MFWGLKTYLLKFPEGMAFDLNQNPSRRGKKAYDTMFTLTTGSSRIWLVKPARYLSGTEALLMHGIPITKQAASAMRTTQVTIVHQSNTSRCFMAGNSMHCANVGTCLAFILFFIGPLYSMHSSGWFFPDCRQKFISHTPAMSKHSELNHGQGKSKRCNQKKTTYQT